MTPLYITPTAFAKATGYNLFTVYSFIRTGEIVPFKPVDDRYMIDSALVPLWKERYKAWTKTKRYLNRKKK